MSRFAVGMLFIESLSTVSADNVDDLFRSTRMRIDQARHIVNFLMNHRPLFSSAKGLRKGLGVNLVSTICTISLKFCFQ